MSARAWLSTRWCARAAISSDPHLIVHERTIKQAHKCNAPFHAYRAVAVIFWIDRAGAMRWGSVSLVLRRVFPGLPKLQRYNAIDRQPAQRKWTSFMCAAVQRLPLFLPLQPPLGHFISQCSTDASRTCMLTFLFEYHPRRPQQCRAFAALASFGHPQMQLSYICSGLDLERPALATNRRRLFDIVVLLHTSLSSLAKACMAALLVCASGHAWLPVATLDQDLFMSWPWLSV
jgi:hypothetical protein